MRAPVVTLTSNEWHIIEQALRIGAEDGSLMEFLEDEELDVLNNKVSHQRKMARKRERARGAA
jgi:hypothetical protein